MVEFKFAIVEQSGLKDLKEKAAMLGFTQQAYTALCRVLERQEKEAAVFKSQRDEARRERDAALKSWDAAISDVCSVCAGTGTPASGLPCICRGSGRIADEILGLRKTVQELQGSLDHIREDRNRYVALLGAEESKRYQLEAEVARLGDEARSYQAGYTRVCGYIDDTMKALDGLCVGSDTVKLPEDNPLVKVFSQLKLAMLKKDVNLDILKAQFEALRKCMISEQAKRIEAERELKEQR